MADPLTVCDSDADLVALACHGVDAAFTTLMTRHKSWVYRFIRRYVGENEDAYDVLQDTFFAAWRALPTYERDRPFDAWLRRIALNKCRDRARRESVRHMITAWMPGEEAPDVADPAPGPAVITEDAQQLADFERLLRKLPRALKEPLLLTAIEGLSHEEAGAVLGLSAKAVETRVYRARSRLTQLRRRGGSPSNED